MEYCKLQLGIMCVLLYLAYVYWKERKRFGQNKHMTMFDGLLIIGILSIFFDGATVYTVNHLETVNAGLNRILHLCFLLSLDLFIFWTFLYMLSITSGLPRRKRTKILLYSPVIINVFVVIAYIPQLEYREGDISNYSMGVSAYTCFLMAAIYILLSFIIFFGRWRNLEKHKRASIFTSLVVMGVGAGYQMLHPQSLITGIGGPIIILGAYLNLENPSEKKLSHFCDEMVMGFATLVENKDGSTGGHIKRTTLYVRLLAEELRARGYYKEILTKDYIRNLCVVAPMHDIGKISVPDVILQKPGRLTEEEYEIIKRHAASGGEIIRETFANLGNEQYMQMAYEVARYHHEKWNGKGYPEGRKRKEIPLCARIMAIADVFDAVSEKRCYRDALPLDQCFEIINNGSGQDFDPLLVEVFLEIREQVEEAYNNVNT